MMKSKNNSFKNVPDEELIKREEEKVIGIEDKT